MTEDVARPVTATAVVIPEFGSPEVLVVRDRLVRPAAEGEVRVRVQFASVNPADAAIRSGLNGEAYRKTLPPPYVAGMEVSGTVESIGVGVERLEVGDRVMAVVRPRRPEGGGHAELVVLPEASVVAIPSALGLEEAAMVPMNGLTAVEALALLGLPPGSTLLVTGGAGFLASFVIVLARRAGIRVVADAAVVEHPALRARGAEPVDRGPGLAARVSAAAPEGVDAVVDTALLGIDDLRPCLRAGSRVAVVRGHAGPVPDGILVHEVWVRERFHDTAGLTHLAELAAVGTFDFLTVAARLRPEEAARAHFLVEAGGLRGRPLIAF